MLRETRQSYPGSTARALAFSLLMLVHAGGHLGISQIWQEVGSRLFEYYFQDNVLVLSTHKKGGRDHCNHAENVLQKKEELGMVAHSYNSSKWEAETGEFLQV